MKGVVTLRQKPRWQQKDETKAAHKRGLEPVTKVPAEAVCPWCQGMAKVTDKGQYAPHLKAGKRCLGTGMQYTGHPA